MVFKNFRIQVTFRVLLLAISAGALAWSLTTGHYLRAIYAGAAVIVLVLEFIWYADRFNRDIKTFLVSLQQHDFTTHFNQKGRSKSFDELYGTLNRISEVFKTINAEKATQVRFLEMLVEHLRVGIFSMDESGKIHLANQALKSLLRKDVLFSLRSLDDMDSTLPETLREINSGETRLIKIRVQDELLQLSIHASEFRMDGHYHKLISMQNIRNELDAREMEAWQKLIRVLTHEIMNSVSPIISLSETMHGLVERNQRVLDTELKDLYDALDKGLNAIKIRSEGLYAFTQSYRKLTGIPKVAMKMTSTLDVASRVATLLDGKMKAKGIAFVISGPDIPVKADPQLLEQVLINLLLNAIDAVADVAVPRIEIVSHQGKDEVCILVRDNGEGIDDATAEKIFIPFFTTRVNGSGIGLPLVKQILQLHHADITFTSEKGIGTEFTIRL